MAELKRLNHILNDNEIYAKGVVKVPDRPFSTILAGVHSSGRSSPTGRVALKKSDHLECLENKLKSSLLLDIPSTSKSKNFNEVIFNSTIASKPRDIYEQQEEPACDDEEITLLPKSAQKSSPEIVSKFTCSGADADISWIALIICIIIVIVAVPLISSFYIYEHPKQYNHHIVHNNSHSS